MQDSSFRRWERLFYLAVLILALISRFYMLGERAISHDESIHTKFSWNYYAGLGFQHNPMMHGPSLFVATALSYFLFGVSDFTARLFTALVGVALVLSPAAFRRWLGRAGAAATAGLLLISPAVSYYSRYIRHDIWLLATAVAFVWTFMRYLADGKTRWLYWMAASFSLMYTTHEACYIYTAIFMVLLCAPLLWRVAGAHWRRPELRRIVLAALVVSVLAAGVFAISFLNAEMQEQWLDEVGNSRVTNIIVPGWGRIAAGIAFLGAFATLVLAAQGLETAALRTHRVFDVLMVTGTLTLPLGSAFFIKFVAGIDMGIVYDAVRAGDFSRLEPGAMASMVALVLLTLIASVALGLWWSKKHWPRIALIHYALFFTFYTTMFTWGFGALSGLVGSLAYWMAQQGVRRGEQPGYYYLLIGGLYEYLPLLVSVVAGAASMLPLWRRMRGGPRRPTRDTVTAASAVPDDIALFPPFLMGWTVLSWVAFSLAGERMPWLIVHIALPSIFLAGWGIGKLIEHVAEFGMAWAPTAVGCIAGLATLAVGVQFVSSLGPLLAALRDGIPAAGPPLALQRAFGATLGLALGLAVTVAALVWAYRRMDRRQGLRIAALAIVMLLALLTTRDALRANFITYDLVTEFLFYAHGTPDIKVALRQIEEVSWTVTGSPHDIKVAYGEDGSWPLTWYMVHYPEAYFYGTTPDPATLLECPAIIAGSAQYRVVEEVLGNEYVSFDYSYLWWPIQDYFGLTFARLRNAVTDPALRAALWDIAWRRDYTRYAALKNPANPYTLRTWPYRREFRLYVRRDVAEKLWFDELALAASRISARRPLEVPDPFAAGARMLPQVSVAELPGAVIRGIAVAADGTLYLADTTNHRIWHITPEGEVLGGWGRYGSGPGEFWEPWDVALDAEGFVYVADTWNHRVHKYDSAGELITVWGIPGQIADIYDPDGQGQFYGPRAIVVHGEELFVADTGNKRIQVFTLDGRFVRQFGGGGAAPGQMNEPVGLDVDADGQIFVADTWNRRVQVFSPEGVYRREWSIPQWNATHPEEKPMLVVADDVVYVSDAVRQRVLAFEPNGVFRWALGSMAGVNLAFPSGLAVHDSVLYVADAHTGRVVGFALPE